MELNDHEYKMDSSFDTTDSDFLTNDDDYGQNLEKFCCNFNFY